MNDERSNRIDQIVRDATHLTGDDRARLLEQACGEDSSMRAQVEALVRARDLAGRMATGVAVPVTGQTIGAYEVGERIGSGGMGDVYRAHDRRLDRSVAIKMLSEALSGDAVFRARFQREARVLASLQHPHIAAVHGLEESGGRQFLVMELIVGATLAHRLRKMPIDETARYGAQIADALSAAHGRGIVHRDLKPGNIMLTKSGVKVLDFGLAKSPDDETLTATHVVMGTPAYMAPEQRAGKECDARSDIYALGLILHEMATGTRFTGDGVRLEGVPEKLAHVIERCLERDPEERWQTAADVNRELAWSARPGPGASPTHERTSGWRWALRGAVLIAVALSSGATGLYFRPVSPSPVRRVGRFAITLTGETALSIGGLSHDLTLTPDGIVYVGNNGTQLFHRRFDTLESVPIANGTGITSPFVSSDGQWVGYLDNTYVMKKVPITGGPSVTLAGRGQGGATWLRDDTIVYAPGSRDVGLLRISGVDGSSGKQDVLTRPNVDAGEANHWWPEALPGGHAVLFTITAQNGDLDDAQIAVLDLGTLKYKTLFRGSDARYVANPAATPGGPSGYLVYVAQGALRSIPFDLDGLVTRGTATPVAGRVLVSSAGAGDFAVDAGGTLVYFDAPGQAADSPRALLWVDYAGHEEPAGPPPGAYLHVRISPDEDRFAMTVLASGQRQIWIWGVRERAFIARLKFDLGTLTGFPVWTLDGSQIIFQALVAGGTGSMWRVSADGRGAPERLITSPNPQMATSISLDGQLVFHEATGDSSIDILRMTLDGQRRIAPLLDTKYWELGGYVSHDGHWIAYECCTESRPEIYVSPYPDTHAAPGWQVSSGGGRKPVWSWKTNELYFVRPDGGVMRAPFEARGSIWRSGTPAPLFDPQYFGGSRPSGDLSYDLSRLSQRFLMIKPVSTTANAAPPQVVVVQHWDEELRAQSLPR